MAAMPLRLLSFSAYIFILLETGPVATAVSLLRSTNASTHALARVEQRQQACDEGLRALKERLRDDQGFAIPSDGLHTWEVEGGADSGLFEYLGELSRDEFRRLHGPGADQGTVCETGFNYGTSSYAFLCSTEAKVFSWDLGHHAYVEPASDMISREFPERHHLEMGDSRVTLKKAADATDRGPLRARHCDVVYVDGGHSQEIAAADIANFALLSRPGALLVVDDCHHGGKGHIQGVTTAFELAVKAGKVMEDSPMARTFTEGRSICVGRFPKAAGGSFLARP